MFAEEMQQYMNRLLDLEGSAFLPDLLKYELFFTLYSLVFWNFQCLQTPLTILLLLPVRLLLFLLLLLRPA